jgi:hypothetical protein
MSLAVVNSSCIICHDKKVLVPGYTLTCSSECHEKLVKQIEKEFGEFKKVTDAISGISYKVPTRYIIEKGVKQSELSNFPVWED